MRHILQKSGSTVGIIALMVAGIARALATSDIKTTDGSKVSEGIAKGFATLIAIPLNMGAIIAGVLGIVLSLVFLIKPPAEGEHRPIMSSLFGLLFSVFAIYLGIDLFNDIS